MAAFRRVMRARQIAFKGDHEMLVASREAIVAEFHKNANATGAKVDELVNMCDEVEDTLKHQIVQGERKGDGEYQLNVEARHTSLDPSQVPGAK